MIQSSATPKGTDPNGTRPKCRRCGAEVAILKVRDNFRNIDMEFADLEDGYCKQCAQIKRIEDQQRSSEQYRRLRREKIISAVGGPRYYEEFTFERFHQHRDMKAYEAGMNFNPYQKNLLIMGPTGTGKTHLGVAIMRKWAEKNFDGQVLKAYELNDYILQNESQREQVEARNRLARLPILVLDDFGVGNFTDFTKRVVYEILEKRWASKTNGLILTTNLTIGDISELFGERIASRLGEWCDHLTMAGSDVRFERFKEKSNENGD